MGEAGWVEVAQASRLRGYPRLDVEISGEREEFTNRAVGLGLLRTQLFAGACEQLEA